MSDLWANETFLRLLVPLLGALFVTFFSWRLNRTLSQGRPISSFGKRLLSHGFLFMLGLGLLIAWNENLATFLRFPGREVWQLLTVAWAALLIYDASRRLNRERSETKAKKNTETGASLAREEGEDTRRFNLAALLRFLLFFAILGAIGRPSAAAFTVVGALILSLLAIAVLWKGSRRADAHEGKGG